MSAKKLLLGLAVMALCIACQNNDSKASKTDQGLVKVTILYPNAEGKTFDMEYYQTKHMPMLAELMGEAMTHYKIDKGISGRTAEEPIPYLAIGYLYFESLEAYQTAFGPHAEKIVGDIPNYTNIQPILQISEIEY